MPSLYESTVNTGEVSSSNFTTLYNASGLAVPNAGAGSITGNLNVGGNLIVQGTSTLIGGVNLQSTLSLPNYTFPLADGTTDQVLTTDGSGNVYWADVGSLDTNYTIQADTATGGANLNLISSNGDSDVVKFASGTNVTVVRTDENTITINSSAEPIPDGTAAGEVLVWDGSAWTANNQVTSLAAADRFITEYKDANAARTSSALFRRNYAGTPYTTGSVSSIAFQLASDSQAATSQGAFGVIYDAANPSIFGATSTNNFTTSTRVFNINDSEVSFNGTNLVLNSNFAGTTPTANAVFGVERGTVETNATLTWDETQDRWEFNNPLEVQGQITGTTNLDLNGDSIVLRSGAVTQGNAQIIVERGGPTAARLTWNDTQDRWEFNDSLFGSANSESPAQFERRVTSAEINNAFETKSALRLTERVTDAVSNATDQGGPNIVFSRASGTTPGSTEAAYSILSSRYYGTTNTADFSLAWSNDNFTEPTPGNFPGTYALFRAGSNDSNFLNNSLFVNYSAQGQASIASSITGGNTLVFASAHGFANGERIYYTGTTQNGLTQNTYYYVLSTGLTTTQCRIGLTVTGSAVALTNGTGLTLPFSELINHVGINTNSPAYTLDVLGDAHISTDLTVDGDINISGVKFDLSTPVSQGQMLYVSNASPATITNSSNIIYTGAASRPTFTSATNTSGRVQASAAFINDTGAVTYGQGDGGGILMGIDSDSQARTLLSSFGASYDAGGNHQVRIATSTNSFINVSATSITGGNTLVFGSAHGFTTNQKIVYLTTTQNGLVQNNYYYVIATGLTTTQCQLSATLGGSAVALTNGTGLTLTFQGATNRILGVDNNQLDINGSVINLNYNGAGVAGVNASIVVERGTSGADASLTWDESQDRWEFSNALEVQGQITGTVGLDLNGSTITLNSATVGAPVSNAQIIVERGTSPDVNIRWNEATDRWQTTTDGTNYLNIPDQNLDTTSAVSFSSVELDTIVTYNTQTTTTTAVTPVSISATTRVSQKVIIKIIDNVSGELHMLEALAFRKGTTAYLTTYAEIYTGAALATFTADVSGGNTRIIATPASTNNTTYTVSRISLD